MDFATHKFFKKARKRKGFNQEEMAFEMGVPQSTVSRWETGKLHPRADDLIKWCQKTDAQDLLMAVTLNVDVTVVADLMSNLMQSGIMGAIYTLGGLL
ncbi:helix-turn-helix domain-containing protein [Paraliobacillus ryukyuensis]|uniref:helix-turn-helix domain-containing protein n=1 Tax=Paraliobacillus ryukyuensis TaxID=200904 RepID=UPI001C4DFCA2|nr:helix-turn-helix transcriptional regulator [Paraliobacillus ryukyuensis]